MPVHRYREAISKATNDFEDALAGNGTAELRDFLPDRATPGYAYVLCELVRTEIDTLWGTAESQSVEHYLQHFPELLNAPDALSQVCFEEFRQRRLSGQPVAAAEYHDRYGIDITGWQTVAVREKTVAEASRFRLSTLVGMSEEDQRVDVGSAFGDFRMIAQIGSGAIARVFLAEQRDLANRFVVLKLSRHFPQEPRTLSRLQHPNIMPIHSLHRDEDAFAICMPFRGLATLRDLRPEQRQPQTGTRSGQQIVDVISRATDEAQQICKAATGHSIPAPTRHERGSGDSDPSPIHQFGEFSYEQAMLTLFSRLADGLEFAHQLGILHNDLKPENVLLANNGEPLLLDFNLSDDPNEDCSVSQRGGTLPYMSPEQIACMQGETQRADCRSDVYAMGVMLFELLAGQLPFPAPKDTHSTPDLQARQSVPDLRTFSPTVSDGTAAIVNKCMASDPARRYQTAFELKQDIDRQLNNRPLLHISESPGIRVAKWASRNSRMLAVLAVVLMLGVPGFLASHWLRDASIHKSLAIYDEFDELEQKAKRILDHPCPTDADLAEGLTLAQQALGLYDITTDSDWAQRREVLDLPADKKTSLRNRAGHLVILKSLGVQLKASNLRKADASSAEDPHKVLDRAIFLNKLAESCFEDHNVPTAVFFQRAILREQVGDEKQATRLRQRAQKIPARTVTDHLVQARQYFLEQRYENALLQLEEAVKLDPRRFALWFMQGECHVYAGNDREAIECYSVCHALQPEFVQAIVARGLCHFRERNFAQAFRDCDHALKLAPNNLAATVHRTLARLKLEGPAPALADATAAIEANPKTPCLFYLRSQVHRAMGAHEAAAADRRAASKCEPVTPAGWMARGFNRSRGKPRQAINDFMQAAQDLAYNNHAVTRIAAIHLRMGDDEKARLLIDRVLSLNPGFTEARLLRARMLAMEGDLEAVDQEAKQILRARSGAKTVLDVARVYGILSAKDASAIPKTNSLLKRAIGLGYRGRLYTNEACFQTVKNTPDFRMLSARLAKLRDAIEEERSAFYKFRCDWLVGSE